MDSYYDEARRLGQKCYRQAVSQGEYPYLPVLDEILAKKGTYSAIDIGLTEIPAKFIIGTKTSGRTRSFARNYMPIIEDKSEFAIKWSSLCASHLTEGIREPVILWEYMNRFYVQEGNKRVSVLKFFDAVSVPARVKRIMPERTEGKDQAVDSYYAFLDFSNLSRTNFVEFSKGSSYKELLSVLGRSDKDEWTDEDVLDFTSIFYRFEKVYHSCGGDRLSVTTADAMLIYIRFYGYEHLKEQSLPEIKKSLLKIWEEVLLEKEDRPIDIRTNADELLKPRTNLVETMKTPVSLLVKKKPLKIAFVYSMDPSGSRWLANHETGRQYLADTLSQRIETMVLICDQGMSPEDTMKKAILNGAKVIFVPESFMTDACVRVAVDHPGIQILNCSLNNPHRYIRTYYPRIYEAKFVAGVVAGALTDNHLIGYICKYPVYGVTAEINAFARGVSMVNPTARVCLEWSSLGGIYEAEKRLKEKNIHMISYRDFYDRKSDNEVVLGLIDQEIAPAPLVLPVWKWGIFYEKIVASIMKGTYQKEYRKTHSSLNYFWGMSSDVVDVAFSGKLPRGVQYMGEVLCRSIRQGLCDPFYIPDKKDGLSRMKNLEEIITMDQLEENVVGSIPSYNELEDEVKELVKEMGLESARERMANDNSCSI